MLHAPRGRNWIRFLLILMAERARGGLVWGGSVSAVVVLGVLVDLVGESFARRPGIIGFGGLI